MTACYLQNRLPGKATKKTPYELWNNRKPELKHIRIFGSKAFVHVPKEKRTKWEAHAKEGILVGYSETQKGYRILHPETNKVTISRDIVIDENSVSLKFHEVTPIIPLEQQSQIQENNEEDTEVWIGSQATEEETVIPAEPSVRRSNRSNKGIPAKRLSYIAKTLCESEPQSWDEMQQLPLHEKQKWIKAANEEMESLQQLQTWKITKLPQGKPFNPLNVLSCAVGNITCCTLLREHFEYNDPKLQELIITTRRFIFNTHSYLHEEESRMGSNFNENSLLMTIITLLAAGTETTSATLNFALNLISNYPDVQVKVQQEIDEVTGSQRSPGIMDRAQMPYTNAFIHEMQRVLDLAPVAHYHAMTKDTQFRGYTIPKGTTVIPFLSSVLSDPTQWETPEDFNLGHFLDDEGQFRMRPAFMPFSAGKRICAGENLARMELFLLFCALLQKFSFTLPPGTERQDCRKLKQNKVQAQICAKPRPGSSTA
ncbi:cytochrome P450 2D20-like isoform X3 [Engystomops pustulosus]|uniref:cytochrome P450 2D20-like isoform X3 n=1 Tax=Engystomops pustulosus TaxID=76066 RepID=UPI003AFA8192